MIDTTTHEMMQTVENPKHNPEFNKHLTLHETRLLLLWHENIRDGQTMVSEYFKRWPDTKANASTLMKHLRKLKTKALMFHRQEMKQQLLFEYEVLYSEAYQAWLDSKEDQVTVTETREESDKGYKESVQEKRVPQIGNPAHWKNAAIALEGIRALTGADEPKRVEQVIKREMDLILQYLEQGLPEAYFEAVISLLVQYDMEKKE